MPLPREPMPSSQLRTANIRLGTVDRGLQNTSPFNRILESGLWTLQFGARGAGLGQPVADRTVVDDLDGSPFRGEEFVVGVDAQRMVEGRGQVFGAEGVVGGFFAAGVSGADDPASLYAAPGDGHGKTSRPVVTAGD